MMPEKTREAFEQLIERLNRGIPDIYATSTKRFPPDEKFNSMAEDSGFYCDMHLRYMCQQGREWCIEAAKLLTPEGYLPTAHADSYRKKMEKAMRWLGFVQGVLWRSGTLSIDQLKNMNRSDDDAREEDCREEEEEEAL